ncbi:MAG TPA: dihydrofolate reductase family protein [Anaerolineales bacterium]
MRKIIVLSMITLDGVIQAPGDPEEDPTGGFRYGGWTVPYVDDFLGQTMGEQMSGSSDLLLGRKTFEIFASYWPHHEDEWPSINKATKYVVSNTLTKHEWCNSVFLKGNVVDEIKKLKQQEGPDLQVYGSGNLIQTLLKHDLADEFWLRIFPITLGPGKRLFAEGTMPVAFSLHEAKTSPRGVIVASYKRAGEVKTGSF